MELEEAIKVLDRIKRNQDRCAPNVTVRNNACRNIEAIDTVLNELDVLKFKYQARKDRTDTIIKKQEKMIELMAEYIMYKVPFTKETRCLELKEDARTLNSVKQYFEKKAEESE